MSASKKRRIRGYVIAGFIIVIIIAGYFSYRALHKTSGHHQKAADLLGISRRTLTRKLKLYRADAEEDSIHAY